MTDRKIRWVAGVVAALGWLTSIFAPAWAALGVGTPGVIAGILALLFSGKISGWKRKPQDKPKKKRAAKPAFPDSFFMPFSVCPKCGVEALHWMEAPDYDEALVLAAERRKRQRTFDAKLKSWDEMFGPNGRYPTLGKAWKDFPQSPEYRMPDEPQFSAAEMLSTSVMEGSVEVIRTCRECDHVWGQNTSLDVTAEAAA